MPDIYREQWGKSLLDPTTAEAVSELVLDLLARKEYEVLTKAMLASADIAVRTAVELVPENNTYPEFESLVFNSLWETKYAGEKGEFVDDVLAFNLLLIHESIWEPVQFDAALETVQRRHSL